MSKNKSQKSIDYKFIKKLEDHYFTNFSVKDRWNDAEKRIEFIKKNNTFLINYLLKQLKGWCRSWLSSYIICLNIYRKIKYKFILLLDIFGSLIINLLSFEGTKNNPIFWFILHLEINHGF